MRGTKTEVRGILQRKPEERKKLKKAINGEITIKPKVAVITAQWRLIGSDGVKAESVNTWSRANKRTGEIVMTLQRRNERLRDTAGEAGGPRK